MSDESNARDQADAQFRSICEMVAALDVDWDRLEELREECSELFELRKECLTLRQLCVQEGASKSAHDALAIFEVDNGQRLRELEDELASEVEELAELETQAGDFESREDAEQRIQEDPLSVEVRSDWHEIGGDSDPSEFRILLCTGGPAVQIIGELDEHKEPSRAWMEYQDWGTPWTERVNQQGDMSALLTYARQFFFGE